jgi:hypothetical protein
VVVPPGARELEKGVLVVQKREVQLESYQQLLGDLLDATAIDHA